MAAGWPFPSDWCVPAVDAVCEAVADGRDPAHALGWLGQVRARNGVGLGETLHDLAAFYTVLTEADPPPRPYVADVDRLPTAMIRAAALGWADATSGQVACRRVVDELTGLATAGYLRTRLGEIYRSGRPVGDRYVLVVLALNLSGADGWSRWAPMLLAAEAMRAVFDGGETLALASPSVATVLCRRDENLPLRTGRLRRVATELLATDPDAARAGPARVWLERLPTSFDSACALLADLGR